MANVLIVTTSELSDPIALFIGVVSSDRLLHRSSQKHRESGGEADGKRIYLALNRSLDNPRSLGSVPTESCFGDGDACGG